MSHNKIYLSFYTTKQISSKTARFLKALGVFLNLSLFVFFCSVSISTANSIAVLNQSEISWLKQQQKPIKVGITFIPNQVLKDESSGYKGFSIDLFQKIQELAGIYFDYIYFETWNEVIEAGENGDIDVIFLAQKTESRLSHFHFTDSVISQSNGIITKVNKGNNLTLAHLIGKDVAVSKGSALFEYLKYNYPKIRLVPSISEEESLLYVSKGFADAAILESVRASYYLRKLNIKDLRISGDTGYDYNLRIASRKNLAILNVILTKAIDALPPEDIQALHLKWGYVKSESGYFSKQTLFYIAIAFAIIIPFTLFVAFLNKHLRAEIKNKNKALNDLKMAHDEIQKLKVIAEGDARTDYLTNVLNKRGFREKLHNNVEKYKRTQQVFSIVIFDIDYFKKINDKMGHDTGDKVLTTFAGLVKKTLRTYDDIGRVGGEEFAIIFPNTSLTEAVETAERIRIIINDFIFDINHYTFQISASFGVTEITPKDTTSTIFKRADKLLYHAKNEGRNRVCY